jgi:hypothetical protein
MAVGSRDQARSCLSPVEARHIDCQNIGVTGRPACHFDLPAYGHHRSSDSRQLSDANLPNAWCALSGVEKNTEPCSRSEGISKLASLPDENSTVDAILAKSPPFGLDPGEHQL